MKTMIFHIPFYIDQNRYSGSTIRPQKMLKAFKNIGYQVLEISGYGKDRKAKIKKIKRNIRKGQDIEFMYSESSAIPTLLTEKHHLPTYPILDFQFFKFAKKNNIPIGLYYRDIYWKFDEYMVSKIYKMITVPFYLHDLKVYKKYLDILFLQSENMKKFIPEKYINYKIAELPPGLDIELPSEPVGDHGLKSFVNKFRLVIAYVGGMGEVYNMKVLFDVVKQNREVALLVSTRKQDWTHVKGQYEASLSKNIKILHLSPEELPVLFKDVHIASLFIEPSQYRDFVLPLKLYEYMRYEKPILASSLTKVGEFVETNNIGWQIPYNANSLNDFFKMLLDNPALIKEKKKKLRQIRLSHTWEDRAKIVEKELTNLKNKKSFL